MNFLDLPNDIHYSIINKVKNGDDLINLKDTCSKMRTLFNSEIIFFTVDLFKININFEFYSFDLTKHEMICKKFSKFKEEFCNGFIYFNRKTNNSIFDTTTMIHISLYIDNLMLFQLEFIQFLRKYNINKHLKRNRNSIRPQGKFNIKLHLFFGDELFNFIKLDNFNQNKNDIIINYKTRLNIENIFLIYNNLEYYQWKNLNKILKLKYDYVMEYNMYSKFNSCYIILRKKDLKIYLNILIENCKDIMIKIEKDIDYFDENNYSLNIIDNLNERYYHYENKLFNLYNNKLKLYLMKHGHKNKTKE